MIDQYLIIFATELVIISLVLLPEHSIILFGQGDFLARKHFATGLGGVLS